MGKILSPHQKALLLHLIYEILAAQGSTVAGLGRNISEDPSQFVHASRPVWHTRDHIKSKVAEMLRLSSDVGGSHRATNNLPIEIRRALDNLRAQGFVDGWKPKKSPLFRLTARGRQSAPTFSSSAPTSPHANLDMGALFLTIVSKSTKDNTYKFVLGKILLDYCKNNAPTGDKHAIPYDYLADEFVRHYWYQKYKFNMRQHFHTDDRGPRAIQILEKTFGTDQSCRFEDLDRAKLSQARDAMSKTVFASARSYKGNVVHRFQRIGRGDALEQRNDFYDYDDDKKEIALVPDAHSFLRRNYVLLERALVAEWASYLEKANPGLPRIAAKLSSINAAPKLYAHKQALLQAEKSHSCFYCQRGLETGSIDVNHFIPWPYVFDAYAWNLVVACRECNIAKKDSLASEKFVDRLIDRNCGYTNTMRLMHTSLLQLSPSGKWEQMIRCHYTMCDGYGFGVWKAG